MTLAGGLAAAFFMGHLGVARIGAPLKSPDVLIERARDTLRAVGVSAGQDDEWGLRVDVEYLNHVEARRPVNAVDDLASRGVLFWYRESPVLFERLVFLQPDLMPRMTSTDPPMRYRGESRVVLDREGRLVSLEIMPPQRHDAQATDADADWALLFRAAGLDLTAWVPTDPRWTPSAFADRRLAWQPRDGSTTSAEGVEAGSFQGQPVSFNLIFPWTTPIRDVATRRTPAERTANLVMVLIFTAVMVGSALVARRNLRLDRGDRRGAARLAIFIASLSIVGWLLDEHHVASIWELYQFLMAAGWTLFAAALLATFYIALEPHVRRTWPAMIMSWSRLMAGEVRDPLVARDVLIGCAVGSLVASVDLAGRASVFAATGIVPRQITNMRPFLGLSHAGSEVAAQLLLAIFVALTFLFILFVLRKLLRREWRAIVAGALLLSGPTAIGDAAPWASLPFVFVVQALWFTTLARVGLVAMIAGSFSVWTWATFPFTLPASAWYAPVGFVGIAVTAGLAITAFRIATGAHGVTRRSREHVAH